MQIRFDIIARSHPVRDLGQSTEPSKGSLNGNKEESNAESNEGEDGDTL